MSASLDRDALDEPFSRRARLEALCRALRLPTEVTTEVLRRHDDPALVRARMHLPLLAGRATWDRGLDGVRRELGEDPLGMTMLTFMLVRALETRVEYRRRGLPDAIFVDTMRFCARFIDEHHRTHGVHAFTWDFWFARQLWLHEFRIGALEYELVDDAAAPRVLIHVPSDADLERASLHRSLSDARTFLAQHFPRFVGAPMSCETWLLAPAIQDVLPESSRIRGFASGFRLVSVDPADRSVLRWLFGRDDVPVALLPEATSLQRTVKRLLLSDRWPGAALGTVRDDAWATA
ncbi:acyltransferase domain-containing protein [Amnibacterium kyonggiense]|uniref:Uncharacterized protein n=1 Tax=Amnibacterium kyonggiense TaxID=595671 RepID=A0A4R7FKE5_9MICO|nr:acyltransferase domain-containing protein [Amnibacterium kyonggiense]TDS76822.1 hypothetical protein CLV52_1760 [Amnibacterium kyonggiense]